MHALFSELADDLAESPVLLCRKLECAETIIQINSQIGQISEPVNWNDPFLSHYFAAKLNEFHEMR